ncbi:Crp/Fnr family transcriptional regulator [Reinekea marina]|uniref:Crp/Fnr family transcriptional regulator n=1 Tax=Reinekea marina TaxID=1310421 RepID=A0ABV7WSD4_9GAMM|nr:Crp/Fnr family transcriptional regulator [Reinekea marina]MDN3649142.1 Crp/Fnr family transcriptional regulator [Reinekea marina]
MSILRQHDLFKPLSEELHLAMEQASQQRKYKAGSLIFQRGDPGDRLLIIEAGIIEISLMSQTGRKSILNHLTQGDVLGEIAVFDGEPRSADAYAKTDVVSLEISRSRIHQVFSDSPEALWQLVKVLCGRVRNASTMFETRALTSADTRIARCLLKMADLWGKNEGDTVVIQQHLTQGDLGDLSGLARENVNRHLRKLIQEDYVHYNKGQFSLLNIDRLTRIANQE